MPELIPARILNEHVYCPRLAYLEWVDQGFRDSDDTVEGRFVHRRVEEERGSAPLPEDQDEEMEGTGQVPPVSTAVTLSSESLGLIAKIDLLELDGNVARPVEYKRGRPKSAAEPLWEPELVQLCAQALLLEDAGYQIDRVEVYFAETRTRHSIVLDEALREKTLEAIQQLRQVASRDAPPPPLVDSKKCPRCSLNGICLPDEVNYLKGTTSRPKRRLVAGDPPATPLYLTTQGSKLSKREGRAVLFVDGEKKQSRRLVDISHIAVFGNADVSSALLREMFDHGTLVVWLTYGGWFTGIATGMPPGNVEVRIRQHRAAALGAPELAGALIAGKIRNGRTLFTSSRKATS